LIFCLPACLLNGAIAIDLVRRCLRSASELRLSTTKLSNDFFVLARKMDQQFVCRVRD
jgi:hypothetical protein